MSLMVQGFDLYLLSRIRVALRFKISLRVPKAEELKGLRDSYKDFRRAWIRVSSCTASI